ncbi:MAG: alpha-1,4-glucan--maltose-1-phosphate maltosyltransferase [Candidatus Competibacteraceae bacterium]|nr:alpha-1,4-glucan--maltose-1-phosphate maltosyltransferase [Candidatus Competibacteraceae bacterium]
MNQPDVNAQEGRQRVMIERVTPQVDCGRFAAKRTLGDAVRVEVDCFTDSHDQLSARVLYRRAGENDWREAPLAPIVNDRWGGSFTVDQLGRWEYTVIAWVDHFKSWRHDFRRREGEADIELNLKIGAQLLEAAAQKAPQADAETLRKKAREITGGAGDLPLRREMALQDDLMELMTRYGERKFASHYERVLPLSVDDERARFSNWYEFFPRSMGSRGQHGTLKDAENFLPHIAEMGFNVVYLPPIHPIGRVNRKGPNNTLNPSADDPGVPWAIGAEEGGHKSLHPQLGTMADFESMVAKAKELGMEIAMDIAFQCAPDHPWVKEHPKWFRWRPDGSVQYAENPPKKYQDIYPINFESEDWQGLWKELKSVFEFWIDKGVRIFRVDNPHTKAFDFWEWCITEIKKHTPDAIFLAEAFTRPKVMHRLAKLGYNQSYTYFTWRNTKWELAEYMREVSQGEGREYFRPNFWPNTPDILHEYLQVGGRPAHMNRLVLAATCTANYGIYGPPYEVAYCTPRHHGSEEYLDSEKYQIYHWDLSQPGSLSQFIGRINWIRNTNPALQQDWNWREHRTDNEQVICYSKTTDDKSNVILTVVSLDIHHVHTAWVHLDLEALGVDPHHPFEVHDLIDDSRYIWHGSHNFVQLDPNRVPAHVFRIRSRTHTEQDFPTYM